MQSFDKDFTDRSDFRRSNSTNQLRVLKTYFRSKSPAPFSGRNALMGFMNGPNGDQDDMADEPLPPVPLSDPVVRRAFIR